jgi:hypothetical protein
MILTAQKSPRSQVSLGNALVRAISIACLWLVLGKATASNKVAPTIPFPIRVWKRGKTSEVAAVVPNGGAVAVSV